MGYSPFRPHMSFASSAAGGPSQQLSSVAEDFPSSSQDCEPPEEGVVAEVDDAFAMLLSLGEAEQELGRVAVLTVSRMIQNLANSPEDQKLR